MSDRSARSSRWALSFADLCLVLLAFFVLLQAQRGDPRQLAAGVRKAFGSGGKPVDAEQLLPAKTLFETGEAVLRPEARVRLRAIGAEAARSHAAVRIESIGADASSARFDGWELGAARVAAVARAVAGGGIAADRIDVSIPTTANVADQAGQRIAITLSR